MTDTIAPRYEEPQTSKWYRDQLALQAPISLFDAMKAAGLPIETDLSNDDSRNLVFAVMAFLRFEYAAAMMAYRETQPLKMQAEVIAVPE